MMEDIPRCGKCGRWPIDHRAGECIYPADPAVLRAALELVREGLGLPHAKTAGDDAKRMEILFLRCVDLQIMVGAILDRLEPEAHQFTLRYCREQLAKHAATGYHPNDVPIAYGQYDECADGGCGHRKGSHWEHSEPGGSRTGCGYLGCPCTAFTPNHRLGSNGDVLLSAVEDDDEDDRPTALLGCGDQLATDEVAIGDPVSCPRHGETTVTGWIGDAAEGGA